MAHILGNHIENTRTPYLDYRVGTVYQPDEHSLELGRAELLELLEALRQMNGQIVRKAMRDFTIWPLAEGAPAPLRFYKHGPPAEGVPSLS